MRFSFSRFLFLAINVIYFLPPTQLEAQQLLVQLQDNVTRQPITNAYFQTEDEQRGVTNAQGEFFVSTGSGTMATRFSHLAYQDTLIDLRANQQIYFLSPASIELPSISISSRKPRKFRTPRQLLRMALREVQKNYATVVQAQTAVYRELLHRNGRLVNLNEAVVDLETQPYGEKHNHRKVLHAAHNRGVYRPYQLNGKSRKLYVATPEGIQQFPAFMDRYRLVAARLSIGPAPDSFYLNLDHGPFNAVSLDKVRLGYDYLDPGRLNDYNYRLVDTQLVNNVFCYHLQFRPVNDQPTRYFGANKNHYTGVFSGDIYLSLEDLSITRFAAVNHKLIVRNYRHWSEPDLPEGYVRNEVNYARNADDKWQLSSVVASTRSPADTALTATRVLYSAGRRLGAFTPAQDAPWKLLDFQTRMSNLARGYDPAFWQNFQRTNFYQKTKSLFSPEQDTLADNYFFAPFHFDTIQEPRALATRSYGFVRPRKQPQDEFSWLADHEDAATTKYLAWENAYYQQFFRWQQGAMNRVSQQFSAELQGRKDYIPENAPSSADTLLTVFNGQSGFYHVRADQDTVLLRSLNPPEPGYYTTDYGWTPAADYFYRISESRAYDRVAHLYLPGGQETERHFIDDLQWRGDTLYFTENNALLRTAKFGRWTPGSGWEAILEEPAETFEYRMHLAPSGAFVLLRESLTEAFVYRQQADEWVLEPDVIPAIQAGTGGRGRGCKVMDIKADFLADCRSIAAGSCVLAVDSARYEIWLQPAGQTFWEQVPLPPGQQQVEFAGGKSDQLVLRMEGAGTYGKQYSVDFQTSTLRDLKTDYLVVDLPGLRDSILWIEAKDGTSIPCQLRWKTAWRKKLRGTVLKVYAAYGNPYLAGHRSEDIALLNLGYAVGYVHARGGGARGPAWYEAGREVRKLRACQDFLAVVQYFHDAHPLHPTPLFGYAQSAGGPVLGYAVNEAPQLFRGAIFDHAFLDVRGTMSQPDLPLTKYEYTEWGNPAAKRVREAQSAYSPYQNIRPQAYPAMFFLAGRYDQSTPYWQIAKFVAAVRKANQGEAPILLHTGKFSSHPGTPFGPGFKQLLEQLAFVEAKAEE